VHTNRVAATCAVCGKYVPVRTGVPVGDVGDRKFRHLECGEHEAGADVRPLYRGGDRRWGSDVGIGQRIAAMPHPGLAAVGGAVAVVLGVVLLFVAGSDEPSADPIRPAEVSDTHPDVSVLGETLTNDGSTTTTVVGAPASTTGAPGVAPPPGSPTTRPRSTTTRPGSGPAPGTTGDGPTATTGTPGSTATTSAPGPTAPGATTTTPRPATTVRPPTTTAAPGTTTTSPPPPTTTAAPPPTTTTTAAPPPTDPPSDLLGALGDILDGIL
jgi:hypothetical protein